MAAPIFHMAAGAPTPVAPFSHAVEADGWVFVTGQMPNDPNDEAAPLPAGIEGQIEAAPLPAGIEGQTQRHGQSEDRARLPRPRA